MDDVQGPAEGSLRKQIEFLTKQKDALKAALKNSQNDSERDRLTQEHARVRDNLTRLTADLLKLKADQRAAPGYQKPVHIPSVRNPNSPAKEEKTRSRHEEEVPPPPEFGRAESFVPPPPDDGSVQSSPLPPARLPSDIPPPPARVESDIPPPPEQGYFQVRAEIVPPPPPDVVQSPAPPDSSDVYTKWTTVDKVSLADATKGVRGSAQTRPSSVDAAAIRAVRQHAQRPSSIDPASLRKTQVEPGALTKVGLGAAETSIIVGYLSKKGDVRRQWTKRFWVLTSDCLAYFESSESTKSKGELKLTSESTAGRRERATRLWVIPSPALGRAYELEAESIAAREEWLAAIEAVIHQLRTRDSATTGYEKMHPHVELSPHAASLATPLVRRAARLDENEIGSKALIKVFESTRSSERPSFVELSTGSWTSKTTVESRRYLQTFVVSSLQWPRRAPLTLRLVEPKLLQKVVVAEASLHWPDRHSGYFRGNVSMLDPKGLELAQLEVAVVDMQLIKDGDQMQAITTDKRPAGIDAYALKGELGKGACGTVFLGVRKIDQVGFAIKVVEKEKEFEVQTEMEILQMLRHPHCVKLEEMVEMKNTIYMVMELMGGGNLNERVWAQPGHRYSEDEARPLFRGIAAALIYVHENGVVHRDIKPENMMFGMGEEGEVLKLTDFGLATYKENVMTEGCGTPPFMAPELVTKKPYGKEVDMWAFGVSLFQILTGELPFFHEDQKMLFAAIKLGEFLIRPQYKLSPEAIQLLKGLLHVDPKARFTAEQTLAHPWFAVKP